MRQNVSKHPKLSLVLGGAKIQYLTLRQKRERTSCGGRWGLSVQLSKEKSHPLSIDTFSKILLRHVSLKEGKKKEEEEEEEEPEEKRGMKPLTSPFPHTRVHPGWIFFLSS